MVGIVRAICISQHRGTPKRFIEEANFIKNYGIENDAHAGNWHRQVSLLGFEKISAFNKRSSKVAQGAFGENLIIEGIDLSSLLICSKLKCKEIELELTQIGKECHNHCQIYDKVGDCIMPKYGVFAKVVKGGKVKVGDEIRYEI